MNHPEVSVLEQDNHSAIDDEQANLLIDLAVENSRQTGGAQGVNFCPHCGKSLVSHLTPKEDDA